MKLKMIDVAINIDSLFLEDDQQVDDLLTHLREKFVFGYEPTYEILHEEHFDERIEF